MGILAHRNENIKGMMLIVDPMWVYEKIIKRLKRSIIKQGNNRTEQCRGSHQRPVKKVVWVVV